jgi:hypothetical protein
VVKTALSGNKAKRDKIMLKKLFIAVFLVVNLVLVNTYSQDNKTKTEQDLWTKEFNVNPNDLSSVGENDYFILKPGYQLTLQGKEDREEVVLVITVLNETKIVDGCTTRVVEEREMKEGKIIEVSRNYFAIDKRNKDIYYFGESVDIYENGKIVSHGGAWESGKDNAKFGLMIPGIIEIGKKYYQEFASEIAMDRAEIISKTDSLETPAGNFKNCLKIKETSPLEPKAMDYKIFSPGIGLIKDGALLLTKYGFK